jgi:hypothetical protein
MIICCFDTDHNIAWESKQRTIIVREGIIILGAENIGQERKI